MIQAMFPIRLITPPASASPYTVELSNFIEPTKQHSAATAV